METNFEFNPTATLTGLEREWVLEALERFYHDRVISDILYRVKGGKEATVFCCRANPETGHELLAAKIFRPRMFRAMKNDALYREGRTMLDDEGKSVFESRQGRALRRKTRFGKNLAEVSWHHHEYETLRLLYEAGLDVPQPIARSTNVILMEYLGDESAPAPILQNVELSPGELQNIFERLIRNVECFLACNRIHADLSAYNVLYWNGDIKIIDLPQAVDAMTNPNAFTFLARDIDRLCQYFNKQGLATDASRIAQDLWTKYLHGEL
jgi:RIO kinase 1